VTAVIQQQAQAANVARVASGELAPIERCLINENAARQLLEPAKKELFAQKKPDGIDDGIGGLAEVFVTRVENNRYLVCSYLVDYWCLGVKNTFGPRKLDRLKYESLLQKVSSRFGQDLREITLEQAQAIILGAVDYAAGLGLKPHADFEKSQAHLGSRLPQLPSVEFGRNGKPYYISGPYDNPDKIIATLRERVEEGNFDYLMGIGPDLDW
jgi:hypothetical protein